MCENSGVANKLQLRLNQLGEGLGSAYERYALNRFIADFFSNHKPKTVLEIPANGVMGVPGIKSLVFSMLGAKVVLANPSKKIMVDAKKIWGSLNLPACFVVCDVDAPPFKDSSFDLAWNFCCFEHFDNSQKVVSEMARCTRKHVLIEVQNIFNIGIAIHSLYHKLRRQHWDHGERTSMDYRKVVSTFKSCALKIIRVDGNDMPPWPDINMRVSEALEKTGEGDSDTLPFRPNVKTKSGAEVALLWAKPSAETKHSPRMLFFRLWHDLVERISPRRLRILLSHHPYVIGEKQ